MLQRDLTNTKWLLALQSKKIPVCVSIKRTGLDTSISFCLVADTSKTIVRVVSEIDLINTKLPDFDSVAQAVQLDILRPPHLQVITHQSVQPFTDDVLSGISS